MARGGDLRIPQEAGKCGDAVLSAQNMRHHWQAVIALKAGRTFLAAVDELPCVSPLSCSPLDVLFLVMVTVRELDFSNGGATPRIMNDILDHPTHITIALCIVNDTEAACAFPMLCVRDKDRTAALSLTPDDPTLRTRQRQKLAGQTLCRCEAHQLAGAGTQAPHHSGCVAGYICGTFYREIFWKYYDK